MSSKRIQTDDWNQEDYAGYERENQQRYRNPEK
jgi:hypothetical protein